MLFQLLLASTAHFTLTIFSAFVFFAAGLLYLDSWQVNRAKKAPLLRGIGFFLLAGVAIVHATSLEVPLLTLVGQLAKLCGLVFIFVSLLREPLLHVPHKTMRALVLPFTIPAFSSSLLPLSATLMLLIAATYFRKATEGLEKQVKPAFLAFLFLGISETLRIPFVWGGTAVVFWSKMLEPYGPLWAVQHIVEFVGLWILGGWLWGYIRFRLHVQLFVSTVALSLVLFLTITVSYTVLLLRNLEHDALAHLRTDVSVLQYALERLQERTLSYAQIIAQDREVTEAFITQDKTTLNGLATDYMTNQKANTLVIASPSGEVVVRAEDQGRPNDRVGSDVIVQSALSGKALATVSYKEGITAPVVAVVAAAPIRGPSNTTIGVVVTGITIDSAFVDGVKAVTGLDTTVFGGNKRAATTFVAPDGKSRFVGTLETNKKILDTVLTRGEIYMGAAQVLNLPFYTVYAPLKTSEQKVVGMLFVGKLQDTLTDAAEKSISLTFLGSVILIICTLIPAYVLARFLREHAEA